MAETTKDTPAKKSARTPRYYVVSIDEEERLYFISLSTKKEVLEHLEKSGIDPDSREIAVFYGRSLALTKRVDFV